jgi:hypothetical protein
MRKLILLVTIAIGILIAGSASASLYSYYMSKGQNLPSVASRTPIANKCGILSYTGSYEQNIALERCLKGESMLGVTLPTVVALFEDSLAQKLNSTATSTFTLVRGTDKQSRSLSGRYGLIIDEGTSVEEFIIATCAGTTCTIVTRGLDVADGQTAVAGNQYEHRRGAVVKATDYPQLALMTRILNGQDSTGSSTFSIGDGANTDKYIILDTGTTTNTPRIHYDATNNQLKFRRYGETSETEIPLSLRGTYASYAALPTDASNGDIAITTDDYKLYTYNSPSTTWVLAGGSSGAGTVYKTNKLGSESDSGDLKTFSLTAGSWPDSKFLLVYKNGQSQREGASYDYTVTDTDTIQFTTTLASDDTVQMVVVSVDLYNPDWGLVNDDIEPDTNNAYNIGSSSLKFKDGYFAGNMSIGGNETLTGTLAVTGTSTLATTTITKATITDLYIGATSTSALVNNGSADTLHTHGYNDLLTSTTTDKATNFDAETIIFSSTTIPGGTLGTNNVIKISLLISLDVGANAGAVEFDLKFGTSTLAEVRTPGSIAVDTWYGVLEGYIFGAGATNSQEGSIYLSIGRDDSTPLAWVYRGNSTASINSAINQDVSFTAQKISGGGTNTVTVLHAYFEVLK